MIQRVLAQKGRDTIHNQNSQHLGRTEAGADVVLVDEEQREERDPVPAPSSSSVSVWENSMRFPKPYLFFPVCNLT